MSPEAWPEFHLFPRLEALGRVCHWLTAQVVHDPGVPEVTPPEPPEVPGEPTGFDRLAYWTAREEECHSALRYAIGQEAEARAEIDAQVHGV